MGTTAFSLFQPVDAFLCSQLGSGSMAIMSYAQRILVALGTAISLGAYIIAARTSRDAFRSGGRPALRRQANLETIRIVAFGLLVWLGYSLEGHRLLTLALSSSTMSAHDVARLVDTVGWMLIGIGPMAAMPYLFRMFYVLRDYYRPAVLGISIAPCYCAFGWLLLDHYQILALALAYSVVWWLALPAALIWLNRTPESAPSGLAQI
jgi:peptidoglycan biosynthesis protein MviN/MurJ (putative lipid II flippase)